MKLSTRGRYGVTAMYELALNYGGSAMSIKAIAANQNISEHYLEQLISTLRKAGLVKSTRGPRGGYKLAKPPENITVGDIITVMEGPIALVDCLLSDTADNDYCEKACSCVTRNVWAKVCTSISDVLNDITLADLCQEQEEIKRGARSCAQGLL